MEQSGRTKKIENTWFIEMFRVNNGQKMDRLLETRTESSEN